MARKKCPRVPVWVRGGGGVQSLFGQISDQTQKASTFYLNWRKYMQLVINYGDWCCHCVAQSARVILIFMKFRIPNFACSQVVITWGSQNKREVNPFGKTKKSSKLVGGGFPYSQISENNLLSCKIKYSKIFPIKELLYQIANPSIKHT